MSPPTDSNSSVSSAAMASSSSMEAWNRQLLGFAAPLDVQLQPHSEAPSSVHSAASVAAAAAAASMAAGASDALVGDIDLRLSALVADERPLCMEGVGAEKAAPAAAGSSHCSPQTRLERFHLWLQSQHVDFFTCARRCIDIYQLAELLESHGRSTGLVSFFCAGACVLRLSLDLTHLALPLNSLDSWQLLLRDRAATATLSRQSDSLWYHVRRAGVKFSESVPAKARDDTLTALAITAAIAPHHRTMSELVAPEDTPLAQQQHTARGSHKTWMLAIAAHLCCAVVRLHRLRSSVRQ